MTDAQQDPPAGDEQPATPEATQIEVPFGRQATETITLTQHTLGLDPYVLIQATQGEPDADDPDDDGLRLKVEQGGGAEGGILALLAVINLPAEKNPLTAAVKAVIERDPKDDAMRDCLSVLVDYIGFPWPYERDGDDS